MTSPAGLLESVRSFSGILALMFLTLACLVAVVSKNESGQRMPSWVGLPFMEILWFFIAPFARWKSSPAARFFARAGLAFGCLFTLSLIFV